MGLFGGKGEDTSLLLFLTNLSLTFNRLVEGVDQHNRTLREIAGELRSLRQILEPHRADGSTAFRAGERQPGAEADLSWIGKTDEMAQVLREQLSAYLGRPISDVDEREFLGGEAESATPQAGAGEAGGAGPSQP